MNFVTFSLNLLAFKLFDRFLLKYVTVFVPMLNTFFLNAILKIQIHAKLYTTNETIL